MAELPPPVWYRARTDADAKRFLEEQQARQTARPTWSRRERVLFMAALAVVILLIVLNGVLAWPRLTRCSQGRA